MPQPPLGAISSGIRYQVRLFWLHALRMLVEPEIVRVEMEHDEADAVDDLAVFYGPAGKNDNGSLTDVEFFQAKFHVDNRETIDSSYFIKPQKKAARPLILRFAKTWSEQRAVHPQCRLTFFTNWSWNPTDPLFKHVRDDGHIDDEFVSTSSRSDLGKIREQWFGAAGLERDDFNAFVRRLRFQAPWGTGPVEELLRERMRVANLSLPSLDQESNPLDDLGKRFLESGRTVWDADTLKAILEQDDRFATAPPPPRRPVVSVRSFTRFAGLDLMPGDVDIDLSDLFAGRHPHRPEVWSKDIPERLEARLSEIAKLNQPIELALDCHLSIAWYLGYLLGPKSGLSVMLRQKSIGRGTEIWDTTPTVGTPDEWILGDDVAGAGHDLAVAVSLTNQTGDDAKRCLVPLGLGDAHFVHLAHPQPGHGAVNDGPHAIALSTTLIERVRALAAGP